MNVLIILADALRPDHLGCYGYPKNTSPNIDRLAREGVRFENCVATSTHTFPPLVSLLTGQDVSTHNLLTAQDYADWILKDTWKGRRTPLHVLREAGWQADGEYVTRWKPLGFTHDENDLPAYLERNRDRKWFYFASPYPTHMPYNPPEDYYRMFVDPDFQPDEETLKRMEMARSKMICHPPGIKSAMEVGQPDAIGIPDEEHQRSVAEVEFRPEDAPGIRALYDGEVRVFDDWIGSRLAKLEELGLLDDTLVVLVSDHGEELLERGHVGHTSCNLAGTVYDECLRVPLIMRHPPTLPAGAVIRDQVSQIDVLPTIFHLLGLEVPPPVDGTSLLPLIRGEATGFREQAYAATPPAGWQRLLSDRRLIWCVRTLKRKLILNLDPDAEKTRRYELYDLEQDPGERNDIFDQERESPATKELMDRLEEHVSRRPSA